MIISDLAVIVRFDSSLS